MCGETTACSQPIASVGIDNLLQVGSNFDALDCAERPRPEAVEKCKGSEEWLLLNGFKMI